MPEMSKPDILRSDPKAGASSSTPVEGQGPLPPRDRKKGMVAAVYHRSGPLPDPQALREYDGIAPGLADRIVTMAEQQGAHRRAIEVIVIRGNTRRSWMGVIGGTVVLLAICAVAALMVLRDQALTGLTALVGEMVLLAGIYLETKLGRRKELAEKETDSSEGPGLGPLPPR